MADTRQAPVRIQGAYRPGEKQKNGFGICIYGSGGVGKTTLIGTMPGQGLVIDVPEVEGGTVVLSDKADRIDVVSVSTWSEIEEKFWFLRDKPHPYQWVAIDSITAFTELAKRKTIAERGALTIEHADRHTLSQPDWGKVGRLVGELVYQFRTLPIHTIWIAQERSFGNEETGERKIGPDTSPSALQSLIPSMMLIGRLSVDLSDASGEWERRLRIGPHPMFYTKYRTTPDKDVPYWIVRPNLGTILKFLLGSGERPEEVKEFQDLVLG